MAAWAGYDEQTREMTVRLSPHILLMIEFGVMATIAKHAGATAECFVGAACAVWKGRRQWPLLLLQHQLGFER